MDTLVPLFFTLCYGLVSTYLLAYVAHKYYTQRWAASMIGFHFLVIVVRNGLTTSELLVLPGAVWTNVHWTTISVAVLACGYQWITNEWRRL